MSTPAGWYHAPGDPEGTQRYWDGAQWVGDPQPVQQATAQTTSASAGSAGAVPGWAPAGYQAFTTPGSFGVQQPADFGQRVIAYLIDVGLAAVIMLGGLLVGILVGSASEGLGTIIIIVSYVGGLGFFIWNTIIKQGRTGQSIGKKQQRISLIKDETRQPVGGGMCFARYLVGQAISSVTCCIGGLGDVLWPLWDPEKLRLTDNVLSMSVVKV